MKKKKQISKSRFQFHINPTEVVKQRNFGAYEVVKVKGGIIFRTYTGYMLYFSEFTTDKDGKASPLTAYLWLDNMLNIADYAEKNGQEMFPDTDMTYIDVLNYYQIVTEANLTYPLVAFIDVDKATEFADKHIKWLADKAEQLESAVFGEVKEETEEDVKKNVENAEKAVMAEDIKQILE